MGKLTSSDVGQIISLYTSPRSDGSFPTIAEIAPRFGVSTATIGRAINAAGISGTPRKGVKQRKLSAEDIDAIIRLYTTPLPKGTLRSTNDIATQFGVTNTCVLYHLRRQGVAIRTSGETQAGHAYRPIINKPPEGESPPPCKCGCGQLVEWDRKHKRWKQYADGHHRPKRPYHDGRWLHREYVVKGRAATALASESGVSINSICKALEKNGIKARPMGESLHLSGASRGVNNPAWKGGVAEWDYAFNWKSLTKSIKDRDEWTCQLCGACRKRWGYHLHVHHINEDKTDNREQNLVSLCSSCHRAVHSDTAIAEKLRVKLSHDYSPFKEMSYAGR